MFIKLTRASDGAPLFVDFARGICMLSANAGTLFGTLSGWAVRETPEEILAAIAAAERTAVPEEVTEEVLAKAARAAFDVYESLPPSADGTNREAAILVALRVMREGR